MEYIFYCATAAILVSAGMDLHNATKNISNKDHD